MSNDLFNKHTGLAIVCPITSTERHVPFRVRITTDARLTGFVLEQRDSIRIPISW